MPLQPTYEIPISVPEHVASDSHAVTSILHIWSDALRAHDSYTHAHSRRVIYYALTLGRLLGLGEGELHTLQQGVFLHDIGKLHIPESILKKPSELSEAEWIAMRLHPSAGYEMVRAIPSFAEAAEIILSHHEWYDGSGYPYGLKGQEIPLNARICSLVDTLDAITSLRPYRSPMSFAAAFDCIQAESGSHFDPFLVDTFTALPSWRWQRIQLMSAASPSPAPFCRALRLASIGDPF